MRKYLTDIDITGAVMCYREGEQCRWSIDWLISNCNRVLIMLDNWNAETESIVLDYKKRYPDIIRVAYSDESVSDRCNKVAGQAKRRFKQQQHNIRERVIVELKKMHEEKPIDLLVWPDSDETFIDSFPEYLEEFWHNQPAHTSMMLGFVEVYESMRILITQRMAPHCRVFKFDPTMSAIPPTTRTRYNPYSLVRPWKIRNLIVHVCHLTEEYREKRHFCDNVNFMTRHPRQVWFLPKDVRKMTAAEIADYQPGHRQAPSKYPSISLEEFIANKDKYQEYL